LGNETAHQSGGWNTPPPPIPARWTAGDGGSIRGTASAFHAPWLPQPHPHPKNAASAVLAGLRCCQALALAQGLVDTDTCTQAPARSAANT